MPSSSISSTNTSRVLPIFCFKRFAEISCCNCMKRWKRSSFTSSGTCSTISVTGTPSTRLNLKQPTQSSWASFKKSSNNWKSSSVSPGKPTIKVERNVKSRQISHHCLFYYKEIKRTYHEVKEAILSLYKKNRKRDGYRPMTFKLRQMGFHLNHKTVLKLMNELGIHSILRKKNFIFYR